MSGIEALSQWVTSKEAELKRQGTETMEHTSLTDGEGLSIKMSEKEIKHAALAIIEDEERHHPLWKIGFLSSNLASNHSVTYFIKDLFRYKNDKFETHVFSDLKEHQEDATTKKIKSNVDFFYNISKILELNKNHVSIKATTTDHLGYIGDSKGWSVISIATITDENEDS